MYRLPILHPSTALFLLQGSHFLQIQHLHLYCPIPRGLRSLMNIPVCVGSAAGRHADPCPGGRGSPDPSCMNNRWNPFPQHTEPYPVSPDRRIRISSGEMRPKQNSWKRPKPNLIEETEAFAEEWPVEVDERASGRSGSGSLQLAEQEAPRRRPLRRPRLLQKGMRRLKSRVRDTACLPYLRCRA